MLLGLMSAQEMPNLFYMHGDMIQQALAYHDELRIGSVRTGALE
jgi:hypothetical protein